MPTQPSDPDDIDEITNAFLVASRALIGISARSLASVEKQVTVTQFRVLAVLERGDGQLNLNGLAEILGVNSSTALRMVDRLLVSGYATRRDNPGNRREVLLGLTPSGRRLVSRVISKRRAEITRIVADMPVRQRSKFVEALRAFTDAAGESPGHTLPAELGW